MEKLLFTLILVLAVGIIYLITGRNRRQINKSRREWQYYVSRRGKGMSYMRWECWQLFLWEFSASFT